MHGASPLPRRKGGGGGFSFFRKIRLEMGVLGGGSMAQGGRGAVSGRAGYIYAYQCIGDGAGAQWPHGVRRIRKRQSRQSRRMPQVIKCALLINTSHPFGTSGRIGR